MPNDEKPENLKLRDALDSDAFDEVVRNFPDSGRPPRHGCETSAPTVRCPDDGGRLIGLKSWMDLKVAYENIQFDCKLKRGSRNASIQYP